VTLTNFGANTLTSATINWSVNEVVQTPFSWTGNLTIGETMEGITISSYNFVEGVVKKIIEEELGSEMMRRVEEYHLLLNKTPVEALKVRERPSVFFRTSENTWVEVVARYLVEPKQSGRVKNRLLKKILSELNKNSDKVRFPSGNNR